MVACNDAAHQCIAVKGRSRHRKPTVVEEDCVGCNLCSIVCPVEDCITMKEVETGLKPLSWEKYAAAGMTGYSEVYKR